jgi:3-oxoacid CoA-transferase subunit A
MNNIYFMGDVHQSFKPIRDLYQTLSLKEDVNMHPDTSDILILLGDSGANFFGNYLDRNFKQKLGRYKFTYFIIRGNHDKRATDCANENPADWNIEEFFGNRVLVEKAYSYIKYAQDAPAVYNIHNHDTLVIPGAYSVDKNYRIKCNLGWFDNEQLNEEEKEIGRKITKDSNFDLVLSHTCPKIYQPTDLFLSVIDQSLVDDSMERYLGEIERTLDYKLWLFGHYHKLRVYPKYEEKQTIMLSNDYILDLDKYFEAENPYDALIEVKSFK